MEPPEFIRRLTPDPYLARHTAFALLVLTYLEAVALADPDGTVRTRVEQVLAANPHLFAAFQAPPARHHLDHIAEQPARDLAAWARAQHLEREDPLVAYELGLLALGVELPPVLVRGLRELELTPDTTVAELPDGSGYPTVFLASLHPHWPAAEHSTLFAASTDARQLAAWAILLLTRQLTPPRGAIVHVPPDALPPLDNRTFDLALVYNPTPGIEPERAVRAARYVVV